jgi:hypothetical protein
MSMVRIADPQPPLFLEGDPDHFPFQQESNPGYTEPAAMATPRGNKLFPDAGAGNWPSAAQELQLHVYHGCI